MPQLCRSIPTLRRLTATALIVSLSWSSIGSAAPASTEPEAAQPTPQTPDKPPEAATPEPATAPATQGKTVAVLRLTTPAAPDAAAERSVEPALELRQSIKDALVEQGYAVRSVALTLPEAAERIKCDPGQIESVACLEALGRWLAATPTTASDYIVYGDVVVRADGSQAVSLNTFGVAQRKIVDEVDATVLPADIVIPQVLPRAVGQGIDRVREPPTPTKDEVKQLAELDEPAKTPEELAAEREALAQAQDDAEAAQPVEPVIPEVEVDLRDDFEAFCRKGPRKRRQSRDDVKDLRPKCQLGPVFGYWQPRAWVALGLTGAAALTMLGFYSAALAARRPYRDATDAVDAYIDEAGADPAKDPNAIESGGQTYAALATDVSRTGEAMRQRAIIGDVMLGTTVLLGAVLAIIIFQDRRDAKTFIREEKTLRAMEAASAQRKIQNLRAGPIFTRSEAGMGLRFEF